MATILRRTRAWSSSARSGFACAVTLQISSFLALRYRARLHGQGGGLTAASSARAAHRGEAVEAKDRAQALNVAAAPHRFARKTLSFSRSCLMHDRVIGFNMISVEFGCAV